MLKSKVKPSPWPEIQEVLGPLSEDRKTALRESIEQHGYVGPPVYCLPDGRIIDGTNRLALCNGKCPIEVLNISEDDGRALALAHNMARRQLNAEQLKWIRAQQKSIALRLRKDGKTQAQAATAVGVTRKAVDQWESKSTSNGSSTNISSPGDPPDLRTKLNHDQRDEIAEQVGAGNSQAQVAANFGVSQQRVGQIVNQHQARAEEERSTRGSSRITDEIAFSVTDDQRVVQCDTLVTDPPYGILNEPWEPRKLETFTRRWAGKWNGCGADLLAIFFSQRHLWSGRTWFDESLSDYEFQQLLVWVYRNNKSPQSRMGFKQTWEPIFLYRKRGSKKLVQIDAGRWGDDVHDLDTHEAAVPQGNFTGADRKFHPAQKPVSVMRWLVGSLSRPGDFIADPFCGSGTTGIAALQLGRKFHGIEIDDSYRKRAIARIRKYGQ